MAGGAYIRIKDGNIYIHAPGQVEQKAAVHSILEPASMDYALPELPFAKNYNICLQAINDKNIPYAHTRYIAFLPNGEIKEGVTDKDGYTETIYSEEPEKISLHLVLNNEIPYALSGEDE